nr:unnamed protein product [Callosobruchus chinensis]CAH7758488.1 unnamed protein product [Callosobruchus chinensis]
MATTPSTIVVFTEDKINFPTKWVMVVMKQLFQYGVKDMSINGDRVFISLTYSPRTATLKRKFGNLPVRYMRVRIDKDEDFKILERVVRRYRFNLLDEQVEDLDNSRIEGGKRKFYLQPPTLLSDDDDSDNNNNNNNNDNGGSDNVNQDGGTKKRLGHQLKKSRGTEAVAAAAAAAVAAASASTSTTTTTTTVAAHSANDDDDAIVDLEDFELHLDK